MKARVGAGAFEAAEPEGFNRTQRARRPHALRGRRARRPGEHRRGERVRVPAGQVDHGQRSAAGIARDRDHVRPDRFLLAGRRPAALDPARLLLQGPAHGWQAAQRRGERRSVVHEPGGGAEPAAVDAHLGERRRRRGAAPVPGRSLGSAKCSDEPIENASRRLPLTSNEAACAAVRSLTTRPPRKAYPGSSSTPATDARVPALVPFWMFPRTKYPTRTRAAAGPAACSASAPARFPGT